MSHYVSSGSVKVLSVFSLLKNGHILMMSAGYTAQFYGLHSEQNISIQSHTVSNIVFISHSCAIRNLLLFLSIAR